MEDFTQLTSLAALLDQARENLSAADLPKMLMSDPGYLDYLSAYTCVLRDGVPGLLERDEDGERRLESFDIGENLLLSHSDAGMSVRHRWFSVLTATLELMGWDGNEGLRWTKPSTSFYNLLTDSYAIADSGDACPPHKLLSDVCRQLRQVTGDRHFQAIALLSQLLVTNPNDDAVDSQCETLGQYHDEFQIWGDDVGNPNPWFVERPQFIWGAVLESKSELRKWLCLVELHFPSSSALARSTRERLLIDAGSWRRRRR